MTLEEQQRIAGKIVLDLKSARSKLACLLKHASDVSKKLDHASQSLKQAKAGVPVEVLDDGSVDHERHWVTGRAINELANEIRRAREEIAELESHLKEL